jgi:outer membrane protein W
MTQCSMQQICSQRIQAKNYDSVFYATTMFTKNTSQKLWLGVLYNKYVNKEYKPRIMNQCSMQQLCSQRIQAKNYDSVFYATTMFTKNTSQELWLSVLFNNYVHKEYKPSIVTQCSIQQLCSQRIQAKNYDSVFYATTMFTKNASQELWLSVLFNNYVHKEYKPRIMTQCSMQQLCSPSYIWVTIFWWGKHLHNDL